MYYRLNDRYLLRGWQKLPWAVVDQTRGTTGFLGRDAFEAASLATGEIDFDFPLIPPSVRKAAEGLAQRGIIEAVAPGGPGLAPEQEYHFFNNRYIESVHWSITGRCNYRCKHCFMSAPEAKYGELPLEDCLKIVDDLAECGVASVSLTGGEPLVRPDFLSLVDALLAKGIRITQIYSNGCLVTERLLDALEERGIHPEFNMSYDGVGWHDWMRGIPGAEEAVERAFKLCQKRGFPTGAEMAIHEGSKGVLRESVRRLGAWGCLHLKTNPVSPVGEWEKNRLGEPISKKAMNEVYLNYIPEYFEDGLPLEFLNLGGFFAVRKSDPEHYAVGIDRGCCDPATQVLCQSARLHAYIAADATLLPCMPLSGIPQAYEGFPNVVEEGLRSCLTSSHYLTAITYSVADYLASNPQCTACEFLSQCAGGCRAHALTADPTAYLGKDPEVCEFYRGGWHERVRKTAEAALKRFTSVSAQEENPSSS